jgi:hypothetical protein
MPPAPDYHDFSIAGFLDQLAAAYESRGYRVGFLPFVYSVDFLPLLAATTDSRTMTIEADADFVGHSWTHICFNGAATGTVVLPRALVLITLDNNQRRLQNQPTMIGNVFGTGPAPMQMFKPLVLPAKSTLTFQVQNLSNSLDIRLRLSLCGVKAFLSTP